MAPKVRGLFASSSSQEVATLCVCQADQRSKRDSVRGRRPTSVMRLSRALTKCRPWRLVPALGIAYAVPLPGDPRTDGIRPRSAIRYARTG